MADAGANPVLLVPKAASCRLACAALRGGGGGGCSLGLVLGRAVEDAGAAPLGCAGFACGLDRFQASMFA